MNYMFSASTAGFYPVPMLDDYVKAGSLPDDLVEVDEATFSKFCESPPLGKVRGANAKGYPAWVDAPPPTPEQAKIDAEAARSQKINDASRVIIPLQDAVDLDMATADEIKQLRNWKRYRLNVHRQDISSAPDIDWPKKPE